MTDELAADLKRRDPGFILRLLLRLGVLVLVVVWGVNALGENRVGACVADGFRAVTGEPAPRAAPPGPTTAR
ncbi:MAG: hypothetical protein KC593_11235 [Myxococcales bacterium]|nr:hypothetical protein [Myxococcales bacterium]MCB9628945.1 hypothetical protein [Sandaracinaceae bacterium]